MFTRLRPDAPDVRVGEGPEHALTGLRLWWPFEELVGGLRFGHFLIGFIFRLEVDEERLHFP